MSTRSKRLHSLLLVAFTGLMYGCGGSSTAGTTTATAQSGKLAQGPVKGATVFADRIGAGTRFVQDGDEISTLTDSNGKFTLPALPNYKYVLVSKGGKDTLTGLDAIQMLAQPGSANITIITTLLTLDTTNTTKLSEKLQALQPVKAPLDFDVSTASTPAMLLLTKSVEIAVQSITTAVSSNAAVLPQQIGDIQFQTLQQIALGFSTTQENLAAPAGLNRALTAAVANAIAEINKSANIHIDSAMATSIAANAVTAASMVLGATPSSEAALIVSSVKSEIGLANATPAAFAATFASAISDTSVAIIMNLNTTIASTPNPYNPVVIFIQSDNNIPGTITGSVGTGGSGGGTGVGYKPVL